MLNRSHIISIAACAALALLCAASPALTRDDDRVLTVGAGKMFAKPSEAAAAARDGDRIEIDSGTYEDCAVWRASSLTIVARDGATLKDRVCQGKAIFVVQGSNVTIRSITFTGARSPDNNGAGIRAEGANLTVEDSAFIDNEEGILSGSDPASTITVRGSIFRGNGSCAGVAGCAHGIYAGHIAALILDGNRFEAQHIGHHIKSRALRTEIKGNVIEDGPTGDASYLVDIPDGGSLILSGNRMQKGPRSDNPEVAVIVGEESAYNPTREIVIEGNAFANDMNRPTDFLRNRTQTEARLTGNAFIGPVIPLSGPGRLIGNSSRDR